MRQVGHLPSCWYAKSANGHVHDLHFSSWKVGAEACIMDFVEVHDGCPSSEKIPGLVGEIQRVWAKNSPIFSVFCVFQQHRYVTLGLLYDWSLQLSKLAWNANFSSCCLFSKFSRCRMKKKMMIMIIVMTMMTTMTMMTMTMMLLLTMTTMTTMRDADEEDEEDLCDDSDVGFVGSVLPFEIMLKGTTPWSSSSGYVRRLRGWCRFLPKVGWHMKFLLQPECHIFWGGGISNLVNIVSCDQISQNMDHQEIWIQPGFLYCTFRPEIHQYLGVCTSTYMIPSILMKCPTQFKWWVFPRPKIIYDEIRRDQRFWSSIKFRWYHWGVSAQWIPTPPSPRKKIKLIMRHLKYILSCKFGRFFRFFRDIWWYCWTKFCSSVDISAQIQPTVTPPKINMKHAKGTLEEIDSNLEAIIFRFYV